MPLAANLMAVRASSGVSALTRTPNLSRNRPTHSAVPIHSDNFGSIIAIRREHLPSDPSMVIDFAGLEVRPPSRTLMVPRA